MIASKAKELGIPEWRVKEGFAISENMDETAVSSYLTNVKQNLVTNNLEGKQGNPLLSTGEATKEEVKSIVDTMIN